MLTLDQQNSALLLIDFQSRLMPAIDDGSSIVANARRLLDAAKLFDVPVLLAEQNASGLGATVPELELPAGSIAQKMTFDACRSAGFLARLPADRALVVGGCETHVCVLQTVLGLLHAGRRVCIVRDAVGSRRAESKETAIWRTGRHGAEIVTTEMVLFEWLGTADDTRLRDVLSLVK